MRPSLLKIKGINSFNGEQVIEFNRLVEKGLFGIFGPTGSGKSSILDAITLVLYGNISRDSKEFINTEVDRGEVSFEFEILDGKRRRTYRLERGIKRKKNGGIETTVARMMELEVDGIKILAEGVTNVNQEVMRVIGLSADDFTRSVVLPQGKFSEFLKLTGRERRNMLERIFGLEQYGKTIMDKISTQRKKYDVKRIDLEGQLKGYEGITGDYYKEVAEHLNLLLGEEQLLKVEILKLDKEYQQGKKTWELQEERRGYEAIKKTLEEKKSEIEENRNQFEMGRKSNLLKPYLTNLKTIEEKINENKINLEKLETDLPRVNEKLKEVQENHQKSLVYKEEQFPSLIAKVESCKQAEEMEEQNQLLIKEIKALEELYAYHYKESQEKAKGLEKLKVKRIEGKEKITEIEKYLEAIYIESHIREGLEQGYSLEKDMERVLLEKKENETMLVALSKVIEENKIKLKEKTQIKEGLEAGLSTFVEAQKHLEQSPLKEENIVFTNKMELEKRKQQLITLRDHTTQRSTLVKVLEALLRDKTQLENNKEAYITKIREAESGFETLKVEVKKIEMESVAANLAQHLHQGDSCPVCGSKEHPHPAEGKAEALLIEKNNELGKSETKLLELKEEKTKIDISLAQVDKEGDMKKTSLEEIEKLVGNQSLEDFRKEVDGLEIELIKVIKEREAYTNNKTKTEAEIEKHKEGINSNNTLLTKLNIEIQKDSESHETLINKIQKLRKNSNEISSSIEKLKEGLKIENIVVEYNQMKGLDKERWKKEKELKDLREIVEIENHQREALEEGLHSLNLEIAKNKQQLDGNKQHLNMSIEKIKKLVEDNNPKTYRVTLENRMKEVEETEKNLKVRVEKGSALQQKMVEEKAIAENNRVNLESEYSLKKQELEKMTQDQGFNSLEEIEKYVIIEEELERLEKQIITYDDDVKNINHNIGRINKALEGNCLTQEMWEQIQALLTEKKQVQEKMSKEIGESQQIVKDVKVKLENIKELKKKEKKITHKLDILLELSKMLEGNKFVEYVAINQLKYIAREASKWLKEITRGRYALELDSSGNFVMRDDFNGGIRRATNTLSGGETFLTSLALALALSSHIQLKGSVPLEFFFLDEGFGTLDSELLEIVMNALERLHSEKLSVGIISHVEELKNRVPIKLMVSPPIYGGEGTTIKII
ncbi:SMC domain protein [Alkaliphilus metalliredigens QYMF]|uniref:Nuclease SbcCD subunit C n=1 Tax=Alkaliphilus metalliredigens (strain QYMF) TaxID=293826 RepID=A6TVN0_ALKMQ|nr:AAA family ATPase [Alkaliphilus metalliredigens]ABR50248.1 SMC domain protein [Alkaliphilus metalliredigens QYMF]